MGIHEIATCARPCAGDTEESHNTEPEQDVGAVFNAVMSASIEESRVQAQFDLERLPDSSGNKRRLVVTLLVVLANLIQVKEQALAVLEEVSC